METLVKVQTEVYIKHSWPDCPIQMSDFLKNEHVHKMIVTVEVSVNHLNRAVEFFVLRKETLEAIKVLYEAKEGEIYDIGHRSMEMVAEELFKKLRVLQYMVYSVECSEDGFFSGKVVNS